VAQSAAPGLAFVLDHGALLPPNGVRGNSRSRFVNVHAIMDEP
jgi:hypothetical protein